MTHTMKATGVLLGVIIGITQDTSSFAIFFERMFYRNHQNQRSNY